MKKHKKDKIDFYFDSILIIIRGIKEDFDKLNIHFCGNIMNYHKIPQDCHKPNLLEEFWKKWLE